MRIRFELMWEDIVSLFVMTTLNLDVMTIELFGFVILFLEYLDSLSCYQEVLQNETLQECNFVYKDLKPWLKSVSAFQFFCKVTSKETLTMKR